MNREDQGRLLTGVGVLGALVGLIVCFKKGGGGQQPQVRYADITVLANGTDVTYHPELIEDASISRADFVIWRVRNQSNGRVRVCVRGFKNLRKDKCEDPLDDSDRLQGKCGTVPRHQSREIRTQVKRSAQMGTYKYSIFVDDREAEDPRLAIVD